MIKPYVITADQVKTFLSISDTTYDTKIDTFIPVITDDLTRKNGICNQSFLLYGSATTAGTVMLSDVSLIEKDWDNLYIGSCIYINGEDGIISAFDMDAETITLETALTETEEDQTIYIRNFPYGAKDTVAKMIQFKFDDTYGNVDIKSEGLGPASISYELGTIDNFGYPSNLTKALKTTRKMRFF